MSIKAKQVAGVTSLVVALVVILSAYHLSTLSFFLLQETASRAELLSRALFQRTREVVAEHPLDSYQALAADGGIRSILESSIGYSENVTYAAIANPSGIAVAHAFPAREGSLIDEQPDFDKVVTAGPVARLLAVFYADQAYEVRQPLLAGDKDFGSIRIGVSTLLVRRELRGALRRAITIVVVTLLISTLMAMLLAQWMLRPIHVIQSSLSRLGRGELDVRLDLPEGDEFKGLGTSFEAVSAQLSASRAKALSAPTEFETVVENLEDAVALFNQDGDLIFGNPAMGALLPGYSEGQTRRLSEMAPEDDAVRTLVERTLAAHRPQGP